MVYIDRDGRVLEKRPWNVDRVVGIFAGLWFLIVQFFQTILAPFSRDNQGNSNRRTGGWGSAGGYNGGGGGGGGGGGSGGGGGNGGLRPNRRIGRINNSMDCNAPGGGCCG